MIHMPEDSFTNSKRSREEAARSDIKKDETKKIEKVISGKVTRRKKPLGRRFIETFFGGEDSENIGEYLLRNVIVPAVKDLATNVVTQGVEKALYGDVMSRGRSPRNIIGGGGRGHISYDRISSGDRSSNFREDPRRFVDRQTRIMHSFADIVLDTRYEANAVLERMRLAIDQDGVVTVADLYDMLDVSSDYTDRKYGWLDNINGSQVVPIKGRYLLDLPPPVEIPN